MKFQPFSKRVYLSSPTMHGEEQLYIKEAFDTNWITSLGNNIDGFEKDIDSLLDCTCAVALSSGTAAIHLALKLAGIKPGDRVFCSDLTFAATVNPVIYEQGIPVFIDSKYDNWNMDPKVLEAAFDKYPDVKIVIAVNLYGTPADLIRIREICDAHGAILVEDAAESLGASIGEHKTGTFGTYNAISFNGNKIITTSGGGMLVCNDEKAAEKARFWSTQAREPAPWYQHKEIGYNYRMSNVIAGIGRGQMLHLQEHIDCKKAIYERYKAGLKDLPLMMNPYRKEARPNYWLSCLLLQPDAAVTPAVIREFLAKYAVEARPIWKPMHLQPVFAGCDYITGESSVSEDIFRRGLCLPSDIKMSEETQQIVMDMIHASFAKDEENDV